MNTATLSVERRPDGVFSPVEQRALLGFLGGYSGLTRDADAFGSAPVRVVVPASTTGSVRRRPPRPRRLRSSPRRARQGASDDLTSAVLRVSEAIGADIQRLGLERGHRTLLVKWTEANAGLRVYSVDADRNELRTSRPHRIRGALRVKENEGWAGFAKHSVRQWRRRHGWSWK